MSSQSSAETRTLPRPQLVLASTSPYRAALLARLGLPFTTAAPAVDEQALPGERAVDLVARLAVAKACAVAERVTAASLVIGSDQVALLDNTILGKPGTEAKARAQLARLSGREVRFLTGLCLLNTATGARQVEVVETPVHFRVLSHNQISDYVRREMPLDCAGAFKSEGLGIALFERIGGDDPNALIGLPLIVLCSMLRDQGVAVLG
ncbi:MAG: nucleoside triphosphate pyrophosphatase [Pseudomonadales bacterium]